MVPHAAIVPLRSSMEPSWQSDASDAPICCCFQRAVAGSAESFITGSRLAPPVGSQSGVMGAGDVFYVVEEGSFTIYDDDENELARVGKGCCFGELALLRQVPPCHLCQDPGSSMPPVT